MPSTQSRRRTSPPVAAIRRPRRAAITEPATLPEHDLVNEATLHELAYGDLDISRHTTDTVDVRRCTFTNVDLSGSVLEHIHFSDCSVSRCDFSNVRSARSSMRRTEVSNSRMTGWSWVDGGLEDVSFVECRMDLCSFRFSTLKRVEFVDCRMQRADFQHADARGARFTNCDLTAAQFSQASLAGARFDRCMLTDIGGVANLAGATVSRQDLIALSFTLAKALGILIEPEDS